MSMKRSIDVTALVVLIAALALFQPAASAQTSAGSCARRKRNGSISRDARHLLLHLPQLAREGRRPRIGQAWICKPRPDDARTWEKALRKLRGHLMPPPGNPQPPPKDVDSFVAWMEDTLDSHPEGPKAGPTFPIQRLNRTEYAASVKALVGVEVNPKDVLPQDIQVDGFDNIADALSVSPAFLDQYIAAARHVAKLAIGDPAGPCSRM